MLQLEPLLTVGRAVCRHLSPKLPIARADCSVIRTVSHLGGMHASRAAQLLFERRAGCRKSPPLVEHKAETETEKYSRGIVLGVFRQVFLFQAEGRWIDEKKWIAFKERQKLAAAQLMNGFFHEISKNNFHDTELQTKACTHGRTSRQRSHAISSSKKCTQPNHAKCSPSPFPVSPCTKCFFKCFLVWKRGSYHHLQEPL